jgi:fatty acid desaturase
MNGNYHGIHHHAPQLCWYELPAAYARSGTALEGSWLAAVARQFRGPLAIDGA